MPSISSSFSQSVSQSVRNLMLYALKTGWTRDQSRTQHNDAAARHELFYPQLGVKTLLDGGRRRTKNLYGVVKRTVPAGQVRQ